MQSVNPSEKGEDEDEPEVKHPLVDNIEASSKGKVRGSVWLKFCLNSGSKILTFFFVPLFFAASQIAASGADYWVKFW